MSPSYHEHIHIQPSLTTRRQTEPYGALSFLSSFFFLARTIIWVSLSLFIYILSCFFLPYSLLLLGCLLGSFGPKTKNQPSRAFDDKQVEERADVSHIIYVCSPPGGIISIVKKERKCPFLFDQLCRLNRGLDWMTRTAYN
jgi:hypothetical protein